jgi:F-type H+-transporting ATPase subunit delta
VQLDTSVDPALIGGVVAKVGSTVYDGSIRMQLEKMRQQMVSDQ